MKYIKRKETFKSFSVRIPVALHTEYEALVQRAERAGLEIDTSLAVQDALRKVIAAARPEIERLEQEAGDFASGVMPRRQQNHGMDDSSAWS